MTEYFVIWTYIANYGKMVVHATNQHEAAEKVRAGFSDDFRKRGTIYVFDSPPKIFGPG